MQNITVISGTVLEGNKRGKRLGFPTINMLFDQSIDEGIYISQIKIAEKFYNSLTFIGPAKTYNQTDSKAETYVFDFDKDIYGETVTVTLLKKIRDNRKFDSEDALIKQMKDDKQKAEKYFAKSD